MDTFLSDLELGQVFKEVSVGIRCLTDYYHDKKHRDLHCLVVSYGELSQEQMETALSALGSIFEDSGKDRETEK